MKTFFTITTFLFTATLIAFYTAGVISKNTRIARETYDNKVKIEIDNVTTVMEQANKEIERLQEENEELKNNLKELEIKKGVTAKKTSSKTTSTTKTTLTSATVAKHSSSSDCWLIINNAVYSVASYITMHPGGRSTIIGQCGKDATTAFNTRGGTGSHSSSAWSLLNQYLVGKIGDTL